jgi:hypothetical protein
VEDHDAVVRVGTQAEKYANQWFIERTEERYPGYDAYYCWVSSNRVGVLGPEDPYSIVDDSRGAGTGSPGSLRPFELTDVDAVDVKGYDFRVIDNRGHEWLIEVKGSQDEFTGRFYMSSNEKAVMEVGMRLHENALE